ncbi:MAG: hypothetical protein EYC70_03020 [Planctomycetota bacterium]|nr:MAG: hypothetical protein EYC70_03020 [Planctomycetota bacterium]
MAASALAYWMGAGLGLGTLAGAWLGLLGGWEGLAKPALPAATALCLAMAPFCARSLRAPGVRFQAAVAAAALIVVALCLAGVGGRDVDPARQFEVAARAPLPQPAASAVAAAQRPDVVLISVDTLRADAILDDGVDTPNLDALRARGLWSQYALAPAPSTLPSHVTMLTGTSVLAHGTILNKHKIPDDVPRLPEELRKAGWLTLGLTANAVIDNRTGLGEGFDLYLNFAPHDPYYRAAREVVWKGPRCTWLGWLLPDPMDKAVLIRLVQARITRAESGAAPGALMRDFALAYLSDAAAQPRPYFLFLHFMDPHQPYSPDPSVAGRLSAGLELPERYRGRPAGDPTMARALQSHLAMGQEDARAATRVLHAVYHEELLYIDHVIGEVLQQVEKTGRPTLVLVTGDHGEQFGEHNLMLHNNSVYEPLLRVPFVLAGPGVTPGKLAIPPFLEDVAPTLLSLCGLPVPAAMEGRNVLIIDPGKRARIAVGPETLAFYDGGWKLICAYQGLGTSSAELTPMALYDVAGDPLELDNRLEREPARVQVMRDAALGLLQAARAPEEQVMTPEQQAALEELGYAGLFGDEDQEAPAPDPAQGPRR